MCDQIKVENITKYQVKARTRHNCTCCEGIIFPNQYYIRNILKIDGEIVVERFHSTHDMTEEESRDSYLYTRHEKY